MPEIYEQHHNHPATFQCTHCEKSITSRKSWSIDGGDVCDDCRRNGYGRLVKCRVEDCNNYEEKIDLTDGMCESCLEVNLPLGPSDQEGWEHNIRRWNEG